MTTDGIQSVGWADIEPIVVGVARGGSDAAVRFAAAEARRTGRPLELVHVAPDTDGWAAQIGQDSLHVALRRARSVAGDALTIHSQTRTGIPVTALHEMSASAALMVFERRASVVRRHAHSSLTEHAADLVDAPLVSVPDAWTSNVHGVVSVGLDLNHPDQRALRTAIHHTRLRGAVLRVLVSTTPGIPRPRSLADSLLGQLGADACELAVEIVATDARAALAKASRRADLLVLGRHGALGSTEPRLGQVSRFVLREAGCPVWLSAPGHTHAATATGSEPTVSELETASSGWSR